MNDSTVEITTIKVKLGDKDVEMTLDQARKLKAALDALFRVETPYVAIRTVSDRSFPPMNWPTNPGFVDVPSGPKKNEIWCRADSQTLKMEIK